MPCMLLLVSLMISLVEANPEETFILPGGAEIEMVWVEPGTFLMGAGSQGYPIGDGPEHEVIITRGFWLGKYEFTLGQWGAVANVETPGWNPGLCASNPLGQPRFSLGLTVFGPDHPATRLSWCHAQNITTKLNAAEGDSVWRLPTEAEWEYACRAGTTTMWFFGDYPDLYGDYAWYAANSREYIQPVGQKLPNPWGLYDMYGNAFEWCLDWYGPYLAESQVDPTGPLHPVELRTGAYDHVVRGGSSRIPLGILAKSSSRFMGNDTGYGGFRCVRLLRISSDSALSVNPGSWGQVKKARSAP